jgi:hypothetical protein
LPIVSPVVLPFDSRSMADFKVDSESDVDKKQVLRFAQDDKP